MANGVSGATDLKGPVNLYTDEIISQLQKPADQKTDGASALPKAGTDAAGKPTDAVKAPAQTAVSADEYKKLTAKLQTLGVKLDGLVDEKGQLKPDKVAEAKTRIQTALDKFTKSDAVKGLKPDSNEYKTKVVNYLNKNTELPLLSQEDQKAILGGPPLKLMGLALDTSLRPMTDKTRIAHAIKLEADARAAKGGIEDKKDAARLYERALEFDPNNLEAHRGAAVNLKAWADQEPKADDKKKLLVSTLGHLKEVLAQDRKDVGAMKMTAQVLEGLDKPQEAKKLYDFALKELTAQFKFKMEAYKKAGQIGASDLTDEEATAWKSGQKSFDQIVADRKKVAFAELGTLQAEIQAIPSDNAEAKFEKLICQRSYDQEICNQKRSEYPPCNAPLKEIEITYDQGPNVIFGSRYRTVKEMRPDPDVIKAYDAKKEKDLEPFKAKVDAADQEINKLRGDLRGKVDNTGLPASERLDAARLVISFDKTLGDNKARVADLDHWKTMLNTLGSSDLNGAPRAQQYCSLLNEWVQFRSEMTDPSVIDLPSDKLKEKFSITASDVTSRMRDIAPRIHESCGYIETKNAQDNIDMMITRIIDQDDKKLVPLLTSEGLEKYAKASFETGQKFEAAKTALAQAKTPDDVKKARGALLEVLTSYTALQDRAKADDVVKLMYGTLKPETPSTEKMEVYTALALVLKDSDFPGTYQDVKTRGDDLVSGMIGEGQGPADKAKRLLLARSYCEATGNDKAVEKVNHALNGLADDVLNTLYSSDPKTRITDPRQRVELASLAVQIDQALLGDEVKAAGVKTDDTPKVDLSEIHMARLEVLRKELEKAKDLPPDFRLEQLSKLSSAAAAYQPLTKPLKEGQKPLIDADELKKTSEAIGKTADGIFDDLLTQKPDAPASQKEMALKIAADLKSRFHAAADKGDAKWLSNITLASVTQFAHMSQDAHRLLEKANGLKGPQALEAYEQAARMFGQLGLNGRVNEAVKPILDHAGTLTDPTQKSGFLFTVSTIYQEAGMTTEANNTLQTVIDLDKPGCPTSIKEWAQIARGMQQLNLGKMDEAKDYFKALPNNPVAKTLLSQIESGQKMLRVATSVEVLRNVFASKAQSYRDKDPAKADAYERAAMGALDQAKKMVFSGKAPNLEAALRMVMYDPRFASADLGMFFFETGPGWKAWSFVHAADNPNLNSQEFGKAALSLARGLTADKYYGSADGIASLFTEDAYVGAEAKKIREDLPDQIKVDAIFKTLKSAVAMNPIGAFLSITFTPREMGSEEDPVKDILTDVGIGVATFGVGKAFSAVADAVYVARAASLLRSSPMIYSVVRWGVRSTAEAAGFTLGSMTAQTLLTGKTDHWTLSHFGKEFGSMLVMFGLMQGVGMLGGRFGKYAENKGWAESQTFKTGFKIGQYGATVGGIVLSEHINEAIGLKEKENVSPWLRILGAMATDFQMKQTHRAMDAVTGGKLGELEKATEQKYQKQLVEKYGQDVTPAVKKMGLDPDSPAGKIAIDILVSRIARGEKVGTFDEKFGEKMQKELGDTVKSTFHLDPKSPAGQEMVGLLFAYAHVRGSKPGLPLEGPELFRAAEELNLSTRLLLKGSGMAEGPQSEALRMQIVKMALGQGMNPEVMSEYAQHASDLKDRLHDITNTIFGPGGSKTAEGQKMMGALLLRSLVTAEEPSKVADALEGLAHAGPDTGDALRSTVNTILGKGATQTPEGRQLMSILFMSALDSVEKPSDIPGKIGQLGDVAVDTGDALRSTCNTLLGKGGTQTAEGRQMMTALLLRTLSTTEDVNHLPDRLSEVGQMAAEWGPAFNNRVSYLMEGKAASSPEGRHIIAKLFLEAVGSAKTRSELNDGMERIIDVFSELSASTPNFFELAGAKTPDQKVALVTWAVRTQQTPKSLAEISQKVRNGELDLGFEKGEARLKDVPAEGREAQKKVVMDRVPYLNLSAEKVKSFQEERQKLFDLTSDPKTCFDTEKLDAQFKEIQQKFGNEPTLAKELLDLKTYLRLMIAEPYAKLEKEFNGGTRVWKEGEGDQAHYYMNRRYQAKSPLDGKKVVLEQKTEVDAATYHAYQHWVDKLTDLTADAVLAGPPPLPARAKPAAPGEADLPMAAMGAPALKSSKGDVAAGPPSSKTPASLSLAGGTMKDAMDLGAEFGFKDKAFLKDVGKNAEPGKFDADQARKVFQALDVVSPTIRPAGEKTEDIQSIRQALFMDVVQGKMTLEQAQKLAQDVRDGKSQIVKVDTDSGKVYEIKSVDPDKQAHLKNEAEVRIALAKSGLDRNSTQYYKAYTELHKALEEGKLTPEDFKKASGEGLTKERISELEGQLGLSRDKWMGELAKDPVAFKERLRVIDVTRQKASDIVGRISGGADRAQVKTEIVDALKKEGVEISTNTEKAVDSMIDLTLTAKEHGILGGKNGLTQDQLTGLLTTLYLHQSPSVRIGSAELTHVPMVVEGTLGFLLAGNPKASVSDKRVAFVTALFHDAGKWDPNLRTESGYTVKQHPFFNPTGKDLVIKPGETLSEGLDRMVKEGALTQAQKDNVKIPGFLVSVIAHHDAKGVHEALTKLEAQGVLKPGEGEKAWQAIERHGLVSSWILNNSFGGIGVLSHVFTKPEYARYVELYRDVATRISKGEQVDLSAQSKDLRVMELRKIFSEKFSPLDRAMLLGDHQGQIDVAKYLDILSTVYQNPVRDPNGPPGQGEILVQPENAKIGDVFFMADPRIKMTHSVDGVIQTHTAEQILLDPVMGNKAAQPFAKATEWLKGDGLVQTINPKETRGTAKETATQKEFRQWATQNGKDENSPEALKEWMNTIPLFKQTAGPDGNPVLEKNAQGKPVFDPRFTEVRNQVEKAFYKWYALSGEKPLEIPQGNVIPISKAKVGGADKGSPPAVIEPNSLQAVIGRDTASAIKSGLPAGSKMVDKTIVLKVNDPIEASEGLQKQLDALPDSVKKDPKNSFVSVHIETTNGHHIVVVDSYEHLTHPDAVIGLVSGRARSSCFQLSYMVENNEVHLDFIGRGKALSGGEKGIGEAAFRGFVEHLQTNYPGAKVTAQVENRKIAEFFSQYLDSAQGITIGDKTDAKFAHPIDGGINIKVVDALRDQGYLTAAQAQKIHQADDRFQIHDLFFSFLKENQLAAATDGKTTAKTEVAYLLEGLSRCPESMKREYLGTLWIEARVPSEGPPSSKPKGGGDSPPPTLRSPGGVDPGLARGFADRGERIISSAEYGHVLVDKKGEMIRPASAKEQRLYTDYKTKFDAEAKKLIVGFDKGQKIIPDGKGGWVLNGADGKTIRPATGEEQALYFQHKRDVASQEKAEKVLIQGFAENGEKILPDKKFGQVLVNRDGEPLRPASKAELRSYLDYKEGVFAHEKELTAGFKEGQRIIPDGKGGWVLNGKDGKTIRAATAEESAFYIGYRRATDAKVKELMAGFKDGQMVVSDGKGGQILQGKDGTTLRPATVEEKGLYLDYKRGLDEKAAEEERQVEVLQAGFYVRGERIIPDKKYGNILVDRDGGFLRPASKQEQGVYLKWKTMVDRAEDLTADAKMEPPPPPSSRKKAGSTLSDPDKTSADTPDPLSRKLKSSSEVSGVNERGEVTFEIPTPTEFKPLLSLKAGETLGTDQDLYMEAGKVLAPYLVQANGDASPQALRLLELSKLPGGVGQSATVALRLLDMIRQDANNLKEAHSSEIVAKHFSDRLTVNLARFEALNAQLKPALEGKPLDAARMSELQIEAKQLGGELFDAKIKQAAGDMQAMAPKWVRDLNQAAKLGDPPVAARANEVQAAAEGIPKTLEAIASLERVLKDGKLNVDQKKAVEGRLQDMHLVLEGQMEIVKSWKADGALVDSIRGGMLDFKFPYEQDLVSRDAARNPLIAPGFTPRPLSCPIDFSIPHRDQDTYPVLRANLYENVKGKVSPTEGNQFVFKVENATDQKAMTDYVIKDLAIRFPDKTVAEESPGLLRITQKNGAQFFVHIEIYQKEAEPVADLKPTVPPPGAKDKATVRPGKMEPGADDKATVRPGKVDQNAASGDAAGKATVKPGKPGADPDKTGVFSYYDSLGKTKVGAPDAKLLDEAAPRKLELDFQKEGDGIYSAERSGLKFIATGENVFAVQSADGKAIIINDQKQSPGKAYELEKGDFIRIGERNYVFTGSELMKADPNAVPTNKAVPKTYEAKGTSPKDFPGATDETSGVQPKTDRSGLSPTDPSGGGIDFLNPVIPKPPKAPSAGMIEREAKVSVDIYNKMYPSEGGTKGRPGFVGYELMRELDTTAAIMGQTGNSEIQKAINADLETVRKGVVHTPQYDAAVDRLARIMETRRHLSDFASTPVDFMNEKTLSKFSEEVGNIYSLKANPSHVADTPPPSSKKVSGGDEWADFDDPSVKPSGDKNTVPPPSNYKPGVIDKEASEPVTIVPGSYDAKALDAEAAAPKLVAQTQKGDVTQGTPDIYRVRVKTTTGPKEVSVRLDPGVSEDLGGAEKNLSHAMKFVNLDKVYDAPNGRKLRFTGNVLGQGSASTIFEAKLVTPGGGEQMVAIKVRTHPRPPGLLAEDPGFDRAGWEADIRAQVTREGKIAEELGKIDTEYQGMGLMTAEGGHPGVILPRMDPEAKFFTHLSDLSSAELKIAGPQVKALVEALVSRGHGVGDMEFAYDKKTGLVHLVDIEGVMLNEPLARNLQRVDEVFNVPGYDPDPTLFKVREEDIPPFTDKDVVATRNPGVQIIVSNQADIENSATAIAQIYIRDKNSPGVLREVEVNVDPRRNAKLNPQDAEDGFRKNLANAYSYVDLNKDYAMGGSTLRFTGRILGQGSAATVFEAQVKDPDGGTKLVAVKIITHPFKEGNRRSFERDVKIQNTLAEVDPVYKDSAQVKVEGVEGLVMPLFDPKTTLFFESPEDLPANKRADAESQIAQLKTQLAAKGLECRDVAFALTSAGKVHIMDVEGIVDKKTIPPPADYKPGEMDREASGPPTVRKNVFPKAMDALADPNAAPASVKAAPTPRQVLGDKVMDAVRTAILSDPVINKKGQLQPGDIHEISCNLKDLRSAIDQVASQIPKDQLPKTLYFVADMKRPDGSHVVSLVKHEIAEDGETRTSPNNSIFTFNYRVTEGTDGKPTRVRVDYIKAREDLRGQVVNPAVKSLMEFAAKEYPGATVETRADNLISGQLAGMNLSGTRFIEITDPKQYPVAHMLDPQLVGHLEKTGVLTSEQATKLKSMIGQSVPEDKQGAHRIEVHNQFIQFVRENYAKNKGEASNEVSFMFQRLRGSKEALAFVRESPYRGDLWVEGQVRPAKEVKDAPAATPSKTADVSPAASDKAWMSIDGNVLPFAKLSEAGGRVIISGKDGQFAESPQQDTSSLFSIRRGPRSYRLDALSGLNGHELVIEGKDEKGQDKVIRLNPPLGQALPPGQYIVKVNGKEMSLNLPAIPERKVS